MKPVNQKAIVIEPLRAEWLAACAEIALSAPDPWGEAALERVLRDENHLCFVALRGGVPVGFACFLAVADAADLEMIAVLPAARRGGVAQRLLAEGFAALTARGVQRCLLEVRASNAPAQLLYRWLGFETLTARPGMYQHPAEDGLLMVKALGEAAASDKLI